MFIAIWKTNDEFSDNTVKQFTSIAEIKECVIVDSSIKSLPDAIIEVNDDSLVVSNEFMISLEVETL
jgi:hypothetical protein